MYCNAAVNFAELCIPGFQRIRDEGFGVVKNEYPLICSILAFCTSNMSIKSACAVCANQLAMMTTRAHVQLTPHSGHKTRKSIKSDADINVTGRVDRKTFTEAINSAFLAYDKMVYESKLVSNCDVRFVSFDSSCSAQKTFKEW